MRAVVADRELALDDDGHPLGGPEIAPEAVSLGAFGQESRDLGTLLGAQTRLGTRGGSRTQRLDSPLSGSLEPLADCSLGHAKSCGDVALLPALLLQLPGAPPTPFEPTLYLRRCRLCLHTRSLP